MVDPDVQKKGGFGAFAERDQERRAARSAEARVSGAPESPATPDPTSPVVPPVRVEQTRGRPFTRRG